MDKSEQQSKNGFTLPELLVVLCLLCLLFPFLLRCFFVIHGQHQQRIAFLELENNLNLAAEYLAEDIRTSQGVQLCTTDALVLQQDTIVTYTLGTDQQRTEHLYPLEGKILYRKESIQWNRQPMANYIEGFVISYLDVYGRKTEEPAEVCAVAFCITGHWLDKTIQKQQVVRLMGKTDTG